MNEKIIFFGMSSNPSQTIYFYFQRIYHNDCKKNSGEKKKKNKRLEWEKCVDFQKHSKKLGSIGNSIFERLSEKDQKIAKRGINKS